MPYYSDGTFSIYIRTSPESEVVLIAKEPIKATLLNRRKNTYYHLIKIHTDPPEYRYIPVEAFKNLIKDSYGDITISIDGESFIVSSERLEISLIGTENFFSP